MRHQSLELQYHAHKFRPDTNETTRLTYQDANQLTQPTSEATYYLTTSTVERPDDIDF